MVEYLQELRVKDGNNIRVINSHIFKEKCMTEEEIDNILDVFSMTTPGIAKKN